MDIFVVDPWRTLGDEKMGLFHLAAWDKEVGIADMTGMYCVVACVALRP